MQRPVDLRIALRFDHDNLRRVAEPAAYPLRLPARELAAPRADLHANLLTSDSTRPGTVCGWATITSRSPSSRAVPAVIGPIVAATKPPDVAVSGPTSRAKLRTVDDEVNVTASMRRAAISEARAPKSS